MEFEKVVDKMEKVEVKTTVVIKHGGEIERKNQVIKEQGS